MARPHIEPYVELNDAYQTFDLPSFSAGSRYKTLSMDADTGACSLKMQFDAGYRRKPGMSYSDAEMFILDGRVEIGDRTYGRGHYFFIPAGVATGAIYSADELAGLGDLLNQASQKFGKRIYLVSDEPYRKISYDIDVPSVFQAYPHSIIVSSYSKELSLAGERIGYLIVHPDAEDAQLVYGAAAVANTMYSVNAPSMIQQAVAKLQGISVDVSIYRRRRDMLCEGLSEAGYKFNVPEGAFYLFPKSPIPDDIEFVNRLKEELILTVPGVGFGAPGYFRLSYAVPDAAITGSLPGFKRAIERI